MYQSNNTSSVFIAGENEAIGDHASGIISILLLMSGSLGGWACVIAVVRVFL